MLAAVVQMALGHKAPGICAWASAFGKHALKPIKFQGESHSKAPMRLGYEWPPLQLPALQLHWRSGRLQVRSRVQAGSSQAGPAPALTPALSMDSDSDTFQGIPGPALAEGDMGGTYCTLGTGNTGQMDG